MVTNADESRITMFGYDGRIWMTEDGGDTFEFFRHMGILFSKLIPHPTDPEYLLAVHVSRCCWSPDISKCSTCSHSVRIGLELDQKPSNKGIRFRGAKIMVERGH
jgi:hypothetical protein